MLTCLVVEPLLDPKKDERARNISVEQAREIPAVFVADAGRGEVARRHRRSRRCAQRQRANAILKILEEPPPQAVLLLVSHKSRQTVPTIRSRCPPP